MKSISQIAQENEDKKLNKFLQEDDSDYDEYEDNFFDDNWRDKADYEYERMMDERAERCGK